MFNVVPESFDDLLKCGVIVIFGLLLVWGVGNRLKLPSLLSVGLYVWHLLLCFVMLSVLAQRGGDPLGYYIRSFDVFQEINFGTAFVTAMTRIFSHHLGLSFLATNLIFHSIGAVGLIFFMAAINPPHANKLSGLAKWFAIILLFMPSLSFWTSPIGKDGIALLGIAIFCWGLQKFDGRLIFIFIGIVFVVLIRPHVGLLMAIAAYGYAALNLRQSTSRSLFVLIVGFFALVALFPIVASKLNLESLNAENLDQFIGNRENVVTRGSGIDLASLSLGMKIVTYLFRPFIFEANDALQFVIAAENLLQVLMFCYFLFLKAAGRLPIRTYEFLLIMFAIVVLFLFAQTTPNLGIAVRQKWMLLVPLYVALFSAARNYARPRAASVRPPHRRASYNSSFNQREFLR
jgi:hypothetical protein